MWQPAVTDPAPGGSDAVQNPGLQSDEEQLPATSYPDGMPGEAVAIVRRGEDASLDAAIGDVWAIHEAASDDPLHLLGLPGAEVGDGSSSARGLRRALGWLCPRSSDSGGAINRAPATAAREAFALRARSTQQAQQAQPA